MCQHFRASFIKWNKFILYPFSVTKLRRRKVPFRKLKILQHFTQYPFTILSLSLSHPNPKDIFDLISISTTIVFYRIFSPFKICPFFEVSKEFRYHTYPWQYHHDHWNEAAFISSSIWTFPSSWWSSSGRCGSFWQKLSSGNGRMECMSSFINNFNHVSEYMLSLVFCPDAKELQLPFAAAGAAAVL